MRRAKFFGLGLLLVGVAHAQEVVIDNGGAGFSVLSGTWTPSTVAANYWGSDYLYRPTSADDVTGEVEWRPSLPRAGMYEVAVWYTSGLNRTSSAPYTVFHANGSDVHYINQQAGGGQWVALGSYSFDVGGGYVRLSNHAGPSVVIADAVRFRTVTPMQSIAPDDPRLAFGGLFFADIGSEAVYLNRFSAAALAATDPNRALNTTGVTVRFRTNSGHIQANFIELPSFNLGDEFGIYQDGVFDRSVTNLAVATDSRNPGSFVTYELACPSYARVAFTGLALEADAQLLPAPPTCRPRYAAFGDSITHGYGQDPSSYLTYPWKLAQARRWELFNLAVSGSKVTPELGAMLDSESLDVVTVLWGQNDWNYENDLPRFISRYQQFLTSLRASHPRLGIYCITLIAAASDVPNVNHGYTREEYRQAVRDIVSARRAAGDMDLFALEGLNLATAADLDGDGIHLSSAGAGRLAGRLAAAIPLPGRSCRFFDSDRDCDIDADDASNFVACFGGPQTPLASGCEEQDADRDGDVDLSDFGLLQLCLSEAGGIDRDCLNH